MSFCLGDYRINPSLYLFIYALHLTEKKKYLKQLIIQKQFCNNEIGMENWPERSGGRENVTPEG